MSTTKQGIGTSMSFRIPRVDQQRRIHRVGMVLLIGMSWACGTDNKEDINDDDASIERDAGFEHHDAGVQDAQVDSSEPITESCGNGQVEGFEQCDDGNNNEFDGCTTLCEFSCEDDEDCDDFNACNGTESCTDEHICEPGLELEDGEPCGSQASCIGGICLQDVCGNAIVQGEEECDDGDLINHNGCTTDCLFTCVSTETDRDCSNLDPCVGEKHCNDSTHRCEGGTPLEDQIACDLDSANGWCINGVCVPQDCGDGIKGPSEQCDEGSDNGKPGSDCSINCRTVKCGNQTVEGDEQCDDGNTTNLDGCDSDCRAEIVHRLYRMDVMRAQPPGFCVYDRNAFGNAFGGTTEDGIINVIDLVNAFLSTSINTGITNSLIQTRDALDPTGLTVDPEVHLGIYSGVSAEEWVEGPPLDFEFLVEAGYVQGDNQPVSVMPARFAGAGLVITTSPTDVQVRSPAGVFRFLNAMSRTLIDVDSASPLPPESGVIESVRVPEIIGISETTQDASQPGGILCGAIAVDSLDAIALDATFGDPCCPITVESYDKCEEGEMPPDCDSFYDLLLGGCRVHPLNLGQCDSGISFSVIYPTEPDVDSDGDGENDAYSAMIAFEGRRARIRGVLEE